MDYDALAGKFGATTGAPEVDYAALAAKFGASKPEQTNPAAANPEAYGMKGEIGENARFNPAAALIGAGDFFSKLKRGGMQAREFLPSLLRGDTPIMEDLKAEREFGREPMQQLRDVHPGSVQAGEVGAMVAVPPALLPAIGALEEGSPQERATRAGLALAGNKLTGAAGNYLAAAPERAAAAQAKNQVRDTLVKELQDSGIRLPPSTTGAGGFATAAESLSGKAKTAQALSIPNESAAAKVIRTDLGLADDAPLIPKTLEDVRANAYATGYKPIADLPSVQGDIPLLAKLRAIAPSSTGGAIKSPARADIDEMVGAVASQGEWTGATLVKDIQSLREQARANYGSANRSGGDAAKTALADAQKKAADALEELAERNIIKNGGKAGAVKDLREARTLIAKSHDVEDALLNGSVDLKKLRGDQLSGKLKMLSDAAHDKAMGPSMSLPVQGAGNPVTVLDAFGTAGLAAADAGLFSLALPAARVGSRALITSKAAQPFMRPDYSQSYLSQGGKFLLDNPYAPALAGMYGFQTTR